MPSPEVVLEVLSGMKTATQSSLMEVPSPTMSTAVAKKTWTLCELLGKRCLDADAHLLRGDLQGPIERMMHAEISAQVTTQSCGRSPNRLTCCNGYHDRDWDTLIGTGELWIPKASEGAIWPRLRRHGPETVQREGHEVGTPQGGGRSGQVPGLPWHFQKSDLTLQPGSGPCGGKLPGPNFGLTVHFTLGERAHPRGQQRWSHHRSQPDGVHR